MRRAARTDSNQGEIVAALRAAGCTVQSLAAVGGGVPDLLVADRDGVLILLECKDGSKPPSARRLTQEQEAWHEEWRGSPIYVVTDAEEAISVLHRM